MFAQSIAATVVSWLGIVGGVLTIFGHLQSAFSLSDWGRWIAAHWQSWMMTFWGDYLGLSHLTSDDGFIFVKLSFRLLSGPHRHRIAVCKKLRPGGAPKSKVLFSARRRRVVGSVVCAGDLPGRAWN